MYKVILHVVIIVVLLMSCELVAWAFTYTEATDAGQSLSTALAVPSGANSIIGALSPVGDIDIYRLTFGTSANLTIRVTYTDTYFDSDTFVFDSAGHPLGNYDASLFTVAITPGTYYLAVSDWNTAATDDSGTTIADDRYNILDTSAVFGGWVMNEDGGALNGGPYFISLSTATVPEPSSILLIVLGASTVAALRIKRRN
ncbi:MAG: PEP-CTERM sorting domain-containing protein [Armatimonadota bacterium]|nr:PEP-CTERM sorting domain-containing protein [bacterium]